MRFLSNVMIHYYRYFFVKKKVFNYSELHFSELTSYKIHTLINEKFQIRSGRFPPVLFGVNGSKNTIIFMSIVLFIRCQQPILNIYLCIYLYLNYKTANILVFVKKKLELFVDIWWTRLISKMSCFIYKEMRPVHL